METSNRKFPFFHKGKQLEVENHGVGQNSKQRWALIDNGATVLEIELPKQYGINQAARLAVACAQSELAI